MRQTIRIDTGTYWYDENLREFITWLISERFSVTTERVSHGLLLTAERELPETIQGELDFLEIEGYDEKLSEDLEILREQLKKYREDKEKG